MLNIFVAKILDQEKIKKIGKNEKIRRKKKSRSKRKHSNASAVRNANHSFHSLTWCKAPPRSTPRNKEMSL